MLKIFSLSFVFLITVSAFADSKSKLDLLHNAFTELQKVDWRQLSSDGQIHFSQAYHALQKANSDLASPSVGESTKRIATTERAVYGQVTPLCNDAKSGAEEKAKFECIKRAGSECAVTASTVVTNWVEGNWYFEQAYLHCKAQAVAMPVQMK